MSAAGSLVSTAAAKTPVGVALPFDKPRLRRPSLFTAGGPAPPADERPHALADHRAGRVLSRTTVTASPSDRNPVSRSRRPGWPADTPETPITLGWRLQGCSGLDTSRRHHTTTRSTLPLSEAQARVSMYATGAVVLDLKPVPRDSASVAAAGAASRSKAGLATSSSRKGAQTERSKRSTLGPVRDRGQHLRLNRGRRSSRARRLSLVTAGASASAAPADQ